jgi:adenylosuccinate synthase
MIPGKFNVLNDCSWGSSAKGAASTRLADIYCVDNVSSCNYSNAGHVVENPDGSRFLFKCLPSPAALRQFRIARAPKAVWVGPNSGFEESQLHKEISWTGYGQKDFFIHDRAVLISQRHKDAEAPGSPTSTEHISSTMSGAGAAFTEKAMRLPQVDTVGKKLDVSKFPTSPVRDATTFAFMVRDRLERGQTFLHEVSQGFALSINHGTHYPQSTFRDCSAQQGLADFLIPPALAGDIYLNVRSLPIRVGNNFRDGERTGYSGDCWHDQQEITWAQVATDAEMPTEEAAILAENEKTSVTKKIRRVFTPSWDYLRVAAKLNGATKLILNFPQYIHWSAYKIRGGEKEFNSLHPKVRAYVNRMEEVTNLPVVMLGTSARHDDYIWRG